MRSSTRPGDPTGPASGWRSLAPEDVRLPGIDGVEALARMREDDRTASIPVPALTAEAMHGDRERFLAAGFDGYLSKPVDIHELIAVVREHCGDG